MTDVEKLKHEEITETDFDAVSTNEEINYEKNEEKISEVDETETEKEKPGPMLEEVAKALPIAFANYIKKRFSAGTIGTLLLCGAIIVAGRCLNLVRVVGDSMNPTYTNGNLLATNKNDTEDFDDIDFYDVVVCDFSDDPDKVKQINGHMIIKRVVGVPGDTIQVIDGYLYRNGEIVKEEFERMMEPGIVDSAITLNEHEFFILGDNRNNSFDSRYIGPVTEDNITNIVNIRILK